MADKKISALTAATTPLAGTEVLPIVQSGTTVKVAVSDLTAGRTVAASQLNVGNLSLATNTISSSTGTVTLAPVTGSRTVVNVTYTSSVGTLINNNATTDGSVLQVASATAKGSGWALIDGYADINGTPTSIFKVRGDGVVFTYENISVQTAAKGVSFGANSAAAGMTSQLLNWYEEGTWTPTDGSGASLSFTVTANNCTYVRNGNIVMAAFFVTYPTTADASGMQINGLPFTSYSSTNSVYGGACTFTNSSQAFTFLVAPNATNFSAFTNAGTQITNAQLSGKQVRGVVMYRV